jgi:hypothetical protein
MECKCLFCGGIVTPEEGFDDARSKKRRLLHFSVQQYLL